MSDMKTYFIQFKVSPTLENEHFKVAEGALVDCWILENEPDAAYAKAEFQVAKYDWNIVNIEIPLVEVFEEDFLGEYIEQYMKAQVEGYAFFYTAWARDKKTSSGPMTINSSYKPDIAAILKKQKQLSRSGRCLHFDNGNSCSDFINAHSIQKNQSLASISRNGHVYTLSTNMSSLNKNKGTLVYEEKGISNVSIFAGFCKLHDNELFEPIDNTPLVPTDQQVLLYAYRSLCRELFVKENALNLLEVRVNKTENHKLIKDMFDTLKVGTDFGLNNLKEHKSSYDESLKGKKYDDIRYVLFASNNKPTMAFTGLFYPDFDFQGCQLQNLGSHDNGLDLITFCSAPMTSGWGFLFAWHCTSSRICDDFMASLATQIHNGHKASDLLFRLVISSCENHAISPEWWENQSRYNQDKIVTRITSMASSFSITKPTYLSEGLEGISDWEFASVITNAN